MSLRKSLFGLVLTAIMTIAPLQARAGIPVIDVTAIANLVQQVGYWQQQITAMSNQLNQLQQTYNSMTGGRGMESLMPVTNQQRNYLPRDYTELMSVANGASTTYAGLSSQVQSAMAANAVLSSTQLANMTPEMRQIVENGRRAAAMIGTMSQSAYQNTSQRFGALQGLMNAIGAAGDTKAILDLQGRIAAEQAMLTNEQTKLQMLYQVAQADQWAQQQRVREQVVTGHGSFGSRFTPTPP